MRFSNNELSKRQEDIIWCELFDRKTQLLKDVKFWSRINNQSIKTGGIINAVRYENDARKELYEVLCTIDAIFGYDTVKATYSINGRK